MEDKKKKRDHHKRNDWDDRLGLIETSILRGSHPLVVGLPASYRAVLLGLYGFCRDLNREIIPPIYCQKNYLELAKAIGVDRRMFCRALCQLRHRLAIYDTKWVLNGNQIATIGLTGLEDKWGRWLQMKGVVLDIDIVSASRKNGAEKEQEPEVEWEVVEDSEGRKIARPKKIP